MSEADRLRSMQHFFPGATLADLQAMRQQQAPLAAPMPQVDPAEALRAKAKLMLMNGMYGAIDPAEGDFYRADMYNTQRAAEGIRKYERDR